VEHAEALTRTALAKAQLASTVRSKIDALEKAMDSIRDYQVMLDDSEVLSPLSERLSEKMLALRLDDLVSAASRAEFKGQVVRAVEMYLEALQFVQSEEYVAQEGERAALVAKDLEQKIESLRGWS